jgi:hypothetical protein
MKKPFVFLLILMSGCVPIRSRACECARNYQVPEPRLIFVGIVMRKETVFEKKTNGEVDRMIRYSFKVKSNNLAAEATDIFIYTSDSDCGARFFQGKAYRVTAKQFPLYGERWYTADCWGNVLLHATRSRKSLSRGRTFARNF